MTEGGINNLIIRAERERGDVLLIILDRKNRMNYNEFMCIYRPQVPIHGSGVPRLVNVRKRVGNLYKRVLYTFTCSIL